MLRNTLYYGVKPLIPLGIRLGLRRWVARGLRRRVGGVWPILPGSERPPEGWPGWPEGKKFGLVLTHDVEGQSGVDKCRKVMALEAAHGFRSSFNFIPEGEYRVSPNLRAELRRAGFEIGVHDLYHDGKLYRSKAEFAQHAAKINEYLRQWDAVGFRSGFMLNKLEWLHQLNIKYDASTFDTDPFEPQPQGRQTIFPFWARGGADVRKGYVELPYTLPQDSTLFLLLREKHPDIWFQKLDWIAEHNGMVLLDTHPDYMNFDEGKDGDYTYPARLYDDLLTYIRTRYAGQFWHATAGELADWFKRSVVDAAPVSPSPGRQRFLGKRAAVLLFSYYPADPRPRREAEVLAKAGMEVELICLRQNTNEPRQETVGGVNVTRVPLQRRREGKLTYFLQYGAFIAVCAWLLTWRRLRKRYDVVHVHNMPDVLVFSALLPKLLGAKIILDLHDPMPELLRAIFHLPESSKGVTLLKWLERISTRFADLIVTVNQACKEIFAQRSCPPEKILVVMNSPDETIFGLERAALARNGESRKPFVIMFHGSIVERHGLDLALKALAQVRDVIPGAQLRIYGAETKFLKSVLELADTEKLNGMVSYHGSKTQPEITKAIRECSVGLIPNRRSIFTEINTPTRIFEYLSLGKPVIAPRSRGIRDYFGEDELVYFEMGDPADLARTLVQVYQSPGDALERTARGQEVYLKHTWSREKERFLDRVDTLLHSHDAAGS